MKRRDTLYRKFIKAKDQTIKDNYENLYKSLRNQMVNLCRASKKLHFQNYFNKNTNNTWKGINHIIKISSQNNKMSFCTS